VLDMVHVLAHSSLIAVDIIHTIQNLDNPLMSNISGPCEYYSTLVIWPVGLTISEL